MAYQSLSPEPHSDQVQGALAALADPTRRSVFDALRGSPRSVADLASEQPVSRPAVSQHLKVLEQAGLVAVQTAGTRRLYSMRTASC